ncbi:hypothetical protein UA08_08683 [Talaromyces atroroseus]|uniref:Xylanolytic transcriptional activator regulatory domain-containing protein n=1 Tax=Talaromyces atroroseus TaxID=1441469 RepID=A0A225AME5_TALAT|nr:hypothetical protein UA08_08683 [Talaromyces atroroseus]OKL56106.1 hypothetical protein UA08_08683 [Talaromyces atroroseus]
MNTDEARPEGKAEAEDVYRMSILSKEKSARASKWSHRLCRASHSVAVTEIKYRPPSKQYVESLLARIKSLEDELTALGQTAAAFPPTIEPAEYSPATEDTSDHDSPGSDERDPVTDVSQLMGRLNVGSDGQLHYFGSQSNYHLLQSQMGVKRISGTSFEMQQLGLLAAAQLNKTVIVSQELRDHLLDLYWNWQNSWNYVVHKEPFMRDLQNGNGKYCSPLLLSAVLALASRYSDRIEIRSVADDPNTAGDAFVEQAKILLLYETEAPTVTTVQAASLLALRTMSDNKDALGWLYCGTFMFDSIYYMLNAVSHNRRLGNATRMAYNIGLNLDCTHWVAKGLVSEEEAEVRKIAWWGVYTIDKLFAIALGRPAATKKAHVTCPRPELIPSVEYGPWLADLHKGQLAPAAHSRIVSVAHSVSESLTIATEAMDEIYSPNNRLPKQTMESIITKADIALQMYYTSLPTFLRLPSSPRVPTLPHIYELHIQYHVCQILLHRPLIKAKTQREVENNSSLDDGNAHMQACRHSATEVVNMLRIYKHFYTMLCRFTRIEFDSHVHQRRIAIVTVHNVFTASVIHLLDVRSRAISKPLRKRSLLYLQICIETLQDLSVAWCAWSQRALQALQVLAKEWHVDEFFDLKSTSSLYYEVSREESAVELEESRSALKDADSVNFTGTPPVLEDINQESSSIVYPPHFDASIFGSLFKDASASTEMDRMAQLWLEEIGFM